MRDVEDIFAGIVCVCGGLFGVGTGCDRTQVARLSRNTNTKECVNNDGRVWFEVRRLGERGYDCGNGIWMGGGWLGRRRHGDRREK